MTPEQAYPHEQLLLQTKVIIPQNPPEYVSRPRLIQRIARGVKGPLTLLAVPVGFGKTNLLIEWARSIDLPVAWLTVDAEDNDPGRFYQYLIGAFQNVYPGIGEETLDFFQSTKSGGVEIGLTLLINEITEKQEEMALVLDDFQNIENPAILESINFLLMHIPQNLHLVIASRVMPELDITTMMAKGMVVDLGVDDLRFTGEEVAQFCQQVMGLDLPPETITALGERTDGWVTALQMAAVSVRNHADPNTLFTSLEGDSHYLVDYLAEEVLDQQSDEVRQFLLRSSVLDTLTSSLVEAVVNPNAQPGYGAVMLSRLERGHLFITALDEKREWFRYHQLFSEFLRHIHSEINPDEIPVLQKRASLWFEENGNLDEAFRYAFASGDITWAADLIERNIQTMIQFGNIFTLTHWVSKLPWDLIYPRLRLTLGYAWGAIATYQLDLATELLNNMENTLSLQYPEIINNHFERDHADGQITDPNILYLLVGLDICRSTLALLNGDTEKATQLSRNAAKYMHTENPFIRSLIELDNGLYYVFSGDTQKSITSLRETIRNARQSNNLLISTIASAQLADVLVLQGKLSLAWSTLQKAKFLAIGPEGKQLPLAGLVDLGLGAILLERNELEEANQLLEDGCEVSQTLWSISTLDGIITLARLRQIQGDIEGSKALVEQASHMALSTESSQWDDSIVSGVAVNLALMRDDLISAEQWWKKGDFADLTKAIPLEKYPYHIFEYLTIIQARFLLIRGQDTDHKNDLRRALELLQTLLPQIENFQRVTSKMEILVIQAMAEESLGQEVAVQHLLEALALGEPEGYRRVYLDEGSRLLNLLCQCRAVQENSTNYLPSVQFIDSLIAEIRPVTENAQQNPALTKAANPPNALPDSLEEEIALSTREIEILSLIAEGKSNKEIASELYLALNTVKRHAYNIYTKLDVNRRTQAVSKARQLGLIP